MKNSKIVCGLILILSLSASGCRARKAEIFRTTPVKVEASELYKEYKDEAEVNKKFQGKYMELTGTVDRVGENAVNQFYAVMKGGDAVGDVRCLFTKQGPDESGEVKAGQTITVRGICLGKVMNVMLDECTIKKEG